MDQRFALDTVDSTQEEARRRLRAGAPPGFSVVARVQEGGRGRLDHGWSSPSGGLYLTVTSELPEATGLLPIGIGAALARGLSDAFAVRPVLKWPNDLLIAGSSGALAKLAGVLVDRLERPDAPAVLVIGLGLNANPARDAFPPALRERVAILSELVGRPVPPPEVEPIALSAIRRTLEGAGSGAGRRALWTAAREELWGVGHRVRVDGRPAGRIVDLAEDGALLVDRDGELETVRTGEIDVEGAA